MSHIRPSLLPLAVMAALICGTAWPALAQDADRPAPWPVQAQSGQPTDPTPTPMPADAAPDPMPANAAAAPVPGPPMQGLAGAYLAARMATVESDFSAAARYFNQAAAQDPDDTYLQDSALVALTAAGRVEEAAMLADRLFQQDRPTELAGLLRRAQFVRDENWDGLIALIDDTAGPGTAPAEDLMDGILRAWALLGAGRATEAVADFEAMAVSDGLAPIVNFHLALARALAGDYETADALMARSEGSSHLMGITAWVQILSQLDRRDDALALLDGVAGAEAEPQLADLRQQLDGGTTIPFDAVEGPAGGIAHLLLSFAAALSSSPDPEPLALIHARLAAWIAPENPQTRLLSAQLLQDRQQFDLAETEFEAVRQLGRMRPQAELSRIDALSQAGRDDEAEQAARALTEAYPDLAQSWLSLGDVLRQRENYADAIPSYDRALDLLDGAPAEARWFPLYARGIALERDGQFDRAEADLLAALEIQPDQASLLNYLGYSWIDRGQNLNRALTMIQRAVELSPDDGYILDSLAWAYFRLGRYGEAVAPMEAAIATMASDPVVNDHLGDIYWKVGRQREAQIQWQRALSLEPGDSGDVDADRLRDKLDRGLDAVLSDEEAAPPPQDEARAGE